MVRWCYLIILSIGISDLYSLYIQQSILSKYSLLFFSSKIEQTYYIIGGGSGGELFGDLSVS